VTRQPFQRSRPLPNGLVFEVDHVARTVTTRYPDGSWTGGPAVPDDTEHAARLRLTPLGHRVAHELAHHLIADVLDPTQQGCPILWAAAHGRPMPDDAALREWWVTAMTYLAFGREQRSPRDWGAFIDLSARGVAVMVLSRRLYSLTMGLV
jgi:hypothetical protein